MSTRGDNLRNPEGRPPTDPNGKPPAPSAPPSRGLFGVALIMLAVLLFVMLMNSSKPGTEINLEQFETLVRNGEVVEGSVEIRELMVVAKQKPGADSERPTPVYITLNTVGKEAVTQRVFELMNGGVVLRQAPAYLLLLPWLLTAAFVLLLFWMISRGLRSVSGGGGMLGNFGKSRHRMLNKEMTGVTFADVAGIDEAKDEVGEIIEFLRNPKKFTRLGGRVPRGVLLIGEPGCGKTLLAKAIAGEADVPFFSISGSDFVEMFVGVGASRVRDLFKQAKESAPCIIFLDEIDAVGRRRGGGFTTGGHDEREQTLNAILVEMDGMSTGDGVIVIAATNRNDVLDPALIRPGRFDRQIVVPLPDLKGRLEILRVHAKKVALGPNVDLERIARATPMLSGADLAAIINESAIGATMQNKDFIEHEDLEEARDKVRWGRARKSRHREKDENRLVAYHEAGHAVLQCLLPDADPLHKVTIIPRGSTGGATFSLPEKDRTGYSLKWLRASMRVACGGRIAEERAMQDVTSGASADITQVTSMARTMVEDWGMSERLGFVRYSGVDTRADYLPERHSDDTARLIDEEVRRITDEAYKDAEQLLAANWEKVEAVAQALLKHETLSADEVHRLMRGESLSKPTISELLAAESRRPAGTEPKSKPKSDEGPASGLLPSPA